METVKHYFGFVFLFLAVYFLRTKIGETVTTSAYGILLILFAAHIGAFNPLVPDAGKKARWRKGIGVVLLVLGILNLGGALIGHCGWAPSGDREAGVGMPIGEADLKWRTDEEAALAEARSSGKPVLLDFTAAWCAACKELDERTWVEPRVAAELDRYVLLRLDLTERTPETQAVGTRWKVQGLPTVIVLDRGGQEVDRFFGFRSADQILPLLKRAG
jgi:thiol:disulfide interchange protein DsbD